MMFHSGRPAVWARKPTLDCIVCIYDICDHTTCLSKNDPQDSTNNTTNSYLRSPFNVDIEQVDANIYSWMNIIVNKFVGTVHPTNKCIFPSCLPYLLHFQEIFIILCSSFRNCTRFLAVSGVLVDFAMYTFGSIAYVLRVGFLIALSYTFHPFARLLALIIERHGVPQGTGLMDNNNINFNSDTAEYNIGNEWRRDCSEQTRV